MNSQQMKRLPGLALVWVGMIAASAVGATLLEETFESERSVISKGGWIYGKPVFAEGREGKGLVLDPKNAEEGVRPGVSFPAGGHFCLEDGSVEMWVKSFADGRALGTAYFFSTREPRLVGEPDWNRNRFVLYACGTGYRGRDHLLFFVIWDRQRKPHRVWTNVTSWKKNEWHKIRAEWKLNDGAGKCRMVLLADDKVAADKPDNDSAIVLDGIGDWLDFGHRRHESGNVGDFWGVLDGLKIEGTGKPLPPTAPLERARRLQTGKAAEIDWAKARELVVNGGFEQAAKKTDLPVGWRAPRLFCSLSTARARSGRQSLRVQIPWNKMKQLRRLKSKRFGRWYDFELGQAVAAPEGYGVRGRLGVDVYAETAVPWFRVGTPLGGPPIECVGRKRLPVGKWVHLSREAILPRGKRNFYITFSCAFTDHYGMLEQGQTATVYIDNVSFKIAGK